MLCTLCLEWRVSTLTLRRGCNLVKNITCSLFAVVLTVALSACSNSDSNSNTTAIEDVSASGAAASTVGGAIQNSAANGTVSVYKIKMTPRLPTKPIILLPFYAATANATAPTCPTLLTANTAGSGCASTGNVATLTYNNCSFSGASAVWDGFQRVAFSSGSTALTCGVFPTPTTDTLLRQFVTSSGSASSATRTTNLGTVVTMDDTTATVNSNYQQDDFNGTGTSGVNFAAFNSGDGKKVAFTSGQRTSVSVLESLVGTKSGTTTFNHTVAGTVNLAESGSGSTLAWNANVGTINASNQCTGGITVYHNLVGLMGSTCFQDVRYNVSCCTPISGTITTTFSKTSQSPNKVATNLLAGVTETLQFNGCGAAVYTVNGVTETVQVSNCF